MLLDGTLNAHLKEIQGTAQNRIEQIINKLKAESDLTEEMKRAAKELDFERAMELRDIIFELRDVSGE